MVTTLIWDDGNSNCSCKFIKYGELRYVSNKAKPTWFAQVLQLIFVFYGKDNEFTLETIELSSPCNELLC